MLNNLNIFDENVKKYFSFRLPMTSSYQLSWFHNTQTTITTKEATSIWQINFDSSDFFWGNHFSNNIEKKFYLGCLDFILSK